MASPSTLSSTFCGEADYGPFQITERIGKVAYRLQLPVESRTHDVFHVSLLKPFISSPSSGTAVALPPELLQGRPLDTPVRAVEERTVLVDGVPQVQWLVHWASDVNGAPSWNSAAQLVKDFPHLRLEDKSVFVGGGVDRDPDKSLHESTNEDDEPDRIEQPGNGRPKRKQTQPAKYADYIKY